MSENEWLKNLQVGDAVIMRDATHVQTDACPREAVEVIKAITDTHFVTKTDRRFRRSDGCVSGGADQRIVRRANTPTSSMTPPMTTSWTPAQKAWVDKWLLTKADELSKEINEQARQLMARDDRPRQVWSEKQPDVFFPSAAQGLLEDLIATLQERV